MKQTLVISLLSLSIACAQNNTSESENLDIPVLRVSMYDSPFIDREVAIEHPYDIELEVIKSQSSEHTLITTVKLFGGSFYVSPHSERDFKGKFRIEIAPNSGLVLGTEFVETPRSQEVIDNHPFVSGVINWVDVDTKYEHTLIVRSEADFEIGGKVVFTIEPKCTLEEIPVLFRFKNGILTIEKWKC